MSKVQTTRPAKRLMIYEGENKLITKILNDLELSPEEETEFQRYKEIWSMLAGKPQAHIKNLLVKLHGISKSQADEWIRKTLDIFGEIYEINTDAERLKQKIRLEGIIFHPKSSVNDKIQAEKLLAKILGFDAPKTEAMAPRRRPMILRSGDPNVLKEATNE